MITYTNKHDSLHLARKYAQIFVLGHYLFLSPHSFNFLELRSRKTVRFQEQIMSVAQNIRIYYPTAANTVQITVQTYSDIVELFVQ